MIFNSLRINNYRAYYGECNFDFPIDGERNISILYADNDVGKSCFFSAILFCLYGPKDSDDLKDLININAQSEKCYHAAVSLFVENGSDKIEISRIIDLRGKLEATPSSKDFKCTLELIKNDVPLSSEEDEKADFINSLVHQDASQYFFFDGEKINDYSTASGSQYKDAIARVLGIKEVDNAVEDLGLLKKEFEKNRDAWIQTQNKYQDILQQKMEADQKVAEQEALLRQYEQEINAANEQIQKDEQELFFIKPTAKVQASSESRGFYDEIVNGKGIFSTKYQLYTFAIMVALLRNATPVPISKTVDICAVDNVDKDNFAVTKGLVAHVCPEINNGSDLLKRMNEYANAGIAILRTDYENNDEDFDPSEYIE